MFAAYIALTMAALFSGAAFYVTFAEQPARLQLDNASLLTEWKLSYRRGFAMQASLAMAGFVSGMAAWWLTRKFGFLLGAVLLFANWPWTFFGMLPINQALEATEVHGANSQTRTLLMKWNRLHIVRIGLGFLAIFAFLFSLSAH
jgi:Domain of unknown function (DUF1772)